MKEKGNGGGGGGRELSLDLKVLIGQGLVGKIHSHFDSEAL